MAAECSEHAQVQAPQLKTEHRVPLAGYER